MKKKILIILGVAAILFVGGIGLALYNLNGIIEKLRPEIESFASSVLGSQVTLGKMDASVFPDAKIKIDEVKLAGSSEKSNLSLRNVLLHVKLLPLMKGKLAVTKLSIEDPKITAIKEHGAVTIEGLMKRQPSSSSAQAKNPEHKGTARTPLPSWLSLDVEEFGVRNGGILFKDLDEKKEISLSKLSANATAALSGDLVSIGTLSGNAELLSKVPVSFSGKGISYNIQNGEASITALSAQLLGGEINLKGDLRLPPGSTPKSSLPALEFTSKPFDLSKSDAFSEFIPILKAFPLKGEVSPAGILVVSLPGKASADAKLTLSAISLSVAGIPVTNVAGLVKAKAELSGQSALSLNAASDNITLSINGKPVKADFEASLADKKVELGKLHLNLFSGALSVIAELNMASALELVFANINGGNINIADAAGALPQTAKLPVEGTLEKLSGKVSANLSDPLKSLGGDMALSIKDGKIKGVNIAADVLRGIKGLPFISGNLYDNANQSGQGKLKDEDTTIKSLSATVHLSNGTGSTKDLKLDSGLFSLTGDGTFGFDLSVDLNATMYFNPEFSASLVGKIKELKTLLDPSQRLVVPLKISGHVPKVLIIPDISKLAEAGVTNLVKQKAGDALQKALSGKKGGKGGLGGLLGF